MPASTIWRRLAFFAAIALFPLAALGQTVDLQVSLSDTPDPITLNTGNVTYTATVYNSSSNTATNVTLTINAPASSTIGTYSATLGGTCNASGQTVTCTWTSMGAFNSRSATVEITPTAGGTLTATASAVANEGDSNNANNNASTTTTVNATIDLQISGISDNPNDITLGQGNVTYTISLYNATGSKATNTVLTVNLPASSTYVSSSATLSGTCSQSSPGVVTCNWATHNAFNSPSVSVTVTPGVGGTNTLTASYASTDQGDPNNANNSGSETTTVNATIDLQLSGISDNPNDITLGQGNVTYTISVYNASTSKATNTVLTVNLPASSTYVSSSATLSGTCSESSPGVVTCNWATHNAFNSPSATITVTPGVGGTNTLTASYASTDQGDPNNANNSGSETTTVNATIDLQLSGISDNPNDITLGQGNVAYTISVYNASTSKATNTVLTVNLPASSTYVSSSATLSGTCSQSSPGVVTCNWATHNAFNSPSATITVTPGVGGTNTLTASYASTDQGDPNNANNSGSETTTVNATIDLQLSGISDNPNDITLGQGNVTYTISVYNASTSKATNTVLTVNLPASSTYVSSSATLSGTCSQSSPGVVTCNWATHNAFNSPSATVTVTPGVGGTNTLTASYASTDQGDPNNANNSGSETTTVNATIDLQLSSISDNPNDITLGQGNVTYTISLYNASTSKATNTVLTVNLPASSTYVSSSATLSGTCSQSSPGVVTCNWATHNAFNSPSATITVTPGVGGTNTLTASYASTDQGDPNNANNSGSQATTVNATIDLQVSSINDNPPNITLGQGNVVYTISLYNSSTSKATNTVLTVNLPASSTYVSSSATLSGTCSQSSPGVVTCNWATHNAFNSPTVTVTVTPGAGGTNTITANYASTDQGDPNNANNSGSETTTVNATIDLQLTLTDSPDPRTLAAGNVTYTVSLFNNTSSKATNAVVTFTYPASTTLVSATPSSGGTCNPPAGNVFTCSWPGDFNAFNSKSLTVVVTPTSAGQISATASVAADQGDHVAANNSDTETTNVNPGSAPTISGFTPSSGPVGTTVTITGANFFSTTSVKFNGVSSTFTVNNNGSITATVPPGAATGPIAITNVVGTTTSGSNFTVTPAPDLTISKTASTASTPTSSTFDYFLTVSNNGAGTANDVTVTDTLPAGVTLNSVSASGWSCSGTTTVICTHGPLAPAASAAVITLNVTAPPSGTTVTNTATVSGTTPDANAGNNSSSVAVGVVGCPATPPITAPATVCASSTGHSANTPPVPGATSYFWTITNGTITGGQGTDAITFDASASGPITLGVSVTATSCPTVSNSVNVNVSTPAATITPSGPTSFCSGGSVTLTANAGTSWLWSNGATTQSITVNNSGTFTVDVTNADGCTATSAPVSTTMNLPPAAPTITPSGPTTFCAGGSVTLTASSATSWLWSNGATTQSITVNASGTFSVTVADGNGCTATSAPTTVTVNPPPATPTIAPSGPTTFCTGGSVTLTASAGTSWLWSNGATTQSIVVGNSGSFSVQVTDANGCTATSAPTSVTVDPAPPTPTIAPSGPTTFCAGGSVTLTASAGSAWLWSNGATTQSIVVGNSGSFSVQVTDANGCTAGSAPETVTVTTANVTITGPAASCASAPVTLDAGPGFASYSWSTGATTQQITVNPASTTSYSVTVTDSNGCTANDAHTVTVTPNPAATIAAPANVCENAPGNTASVPAQPGATYAWTIANGSITSGAGTNAVTFTAGPSGSVDLAVTVTNGSCLATGNVSVPVSPYPTVAISGPASVCPSTNFVLSVPASFTTYLWSTGATTPSITISQTSPSQTYSVTVTNAAGCAATATHTVTLTAEPVATITAPAAAEYQTTHGASVPAQPGATYLWSVTNGTIDGGQGTNAITFTTGANGGTTNLAVEVTLANCSVTGTAAVALSDAEPPPCPVEPPMPIAPANGATLTSPVTFQWSLAPGAVSYDLWVNGSLFATTGGTSLTRSLPGGPVTWHVVANLGPNCNPLTSATRTFTVETTEPEPEPCTATATPLAPANGSTVNSSSIEFTWLPASGADGYRVWASVDGAPFAVLGTTTNETSLRATLSRGSVAWFVQSLYGGCAATDSPVFRFTIPAAQNCGTARPELVAPANGTVVADGNVTFDWNGVEGAIGYEVWLSLNDGTPSLIGTTTGATSLTYAVPAGTLEWFVRVLTDRCPPRDSDAARFTYTPPAACENRQRPVIIEPLAEARTSSPLSLTWSASPGATHYEVFTVRGNAAPVLVATSATNHAGGVNIPNGTQRWFVRAHFGAGCAPLDSAEQTIQIVAAPAACSTLEAPVVAAPGQISSGAQLRIQWSPVAGASSYELQLADDASFANAQTIETSATQHPFTPAEASTLHVRVRARDGRCATANASAFSEPATIYILPAASTTGSAPLTDPSPLTFTYFLGPDRAGQTFTAISKQPWLSVAPASGTVAASGTTLTITADTAGLPVGTSLGAIGITFSSSARGVAANDTTTVTPSFSVSLVTPVMPTTRTTPPPDALIIPAVAHADGINSHFQSDVRVSNTSPRLVTYQLTFTPSGESGMSEGQQSTFSVEPGRTVALDDVLKGWFGTGSGSAIGTLEIRPLTETVTSTHGNAFSGLASLSSFASSRTFNVTANGTFGQYIPAIPFANFIGSQRVLSLQQIAQSSRYRTNLGIVEGSGEPASLVVRMFGANGQQLGSFPLSLNGGQHLQLNAFLRDQGFDNVTDGRVEVEVVSEGGKITAYASVLDNETSDPLLVTPVPLDTNGATKWVVPGVADLASGFANWQTDMRLFNAGTEDVEAALTFYSQNGGEPKTANVTIPAGQVRQFDRALSSIFNAANDGGAVHITTPGAARLIATARTYNQTGNGTYGQFISAVTTGEAAGVDSRPLQLLQVEESDRFRSNVGIAEVTGNPVRLEIAAVPPDAKFTAVTEVFLGANEFRQLGSLLRSMGLGDTHNARVTVRVLDGTGRVTAYASVIDMLTNDPTYVPAQ